MSTSGKKRVAVIGAGAAGLISMKICLEDDLEPVCFELTTDIGGLWNYSTSLIENKGSVMKSTIINSSKENMAFSDFPAPKEFPNFMHNRKLLEYFRLYAKNFNLFQYIKFSTKVLSIKPADNYDATGQWSITYKTKDENEQTEIFEGVMICIGHHACPNIPVIDSLNGPNNKFKGEVIHSWQYRDPMKYVDKRVLVVGVGNSGGDIACELSRLASQTYLSTRTGMWVVPRSSNGGLPTDYERLSRFMMGLRDMFPTIAKKVMLNIYNAIFNHELYAIKPSHDKQHHIFVNDDLPNRIASGTLIIKSNFQEFDGNKCIFDDGSEVDDIDVVILCTGYKIGFPLLGDSIIQVKDNWVNLYKYVFPPQLKHPTLAVMGCFQPIGSINPIVELQARWYTRVLRGLTKLPSKEEMDADIKQKANVMKSEYAASPRHTIQVDFIPYSDEIAELVDCKPNLIKYFFTDNQLWKTIMFQGITPYQFRLNGPGSNYAKARELIMTQHDRVLAPFNTRKVNKSHDSSVFGTLAFITIVTVLFLALFFKYF